MLVTQVSSLVAILMSLTRYESGRVLIIATTRNCSGLNKYGSTGRRPHPPLEVHILNDEIMHQLSLAGCRIDIESQS